MVFLHFPIISSIVQEMFDSNNRLLMHDVFDA